MFAAQCVACTALTEVAHERMRGHFVPCVSGKSVPDAALTEEQFEGKEAEWTVGMSRTRLASGPTCAASADPRGIRHCASVPEYGAGCSLLPGAVP
jgi:hypothetical protein